MIPASPPPAIVGLVLAGGRSRRMGWEKAAVIVNGRPLLDAALASLSDCDFLAVNATAESQAARLATARDLPVLEDGEGMPDGPLSGVLAGLEWARLQGAAWLATSPCDLASPPTDLVARLVAAGGPAYALASDGRHPLSALWPTSLIAPLRAILARDHPPVRTVQDEAGFQAVAFPDAAAFANLNTPGGLTDRLSAWKLAADGPPFRTPSSWLQPVRSGETAAMLKLPFEEEERTGGEILAWFDGRAAARVLRIDKEAVLLERLAGDIDLAAMAGRALADDEAACVILCEVVAALHAARSGPPPQSPPPQARPLRPWFAALTRRAADHSVLAAAWRQADRLLTENRDPRVLHGDIHHGNVLHDPARGWRAIDPKGLFGPRGYDYANILRNPLTDLARDPARLDHMARVIAGKADLPLPEVLGWTLAHAGLSAAWTLESGGDASHSLAVAAAAAARLQAAT
ncbi:MAG: NTP transferase domain-containing protein [Caulobacter sp.]|nr:NTP transferase domain-containing protein [Caulobacter sp.]